MASNVHRPAAISSCAALYIVSLARITLTQGLTLVQFSAQLEPCPTQKSTLHSLNTP